MIKVLRVTDYVKMPWKNGAGVTEEIVRVNQSASEQFAWRVSIADIKQDGDFSLFAGYQRIISVLEGKGMTLEVDGKCSRDLLAFDPFAFSGDAKVKSSLLEGALRDFNLIYDPQYVQARLQWLTVKTTTHLFSSASSLLVFNAGEPVNITLANEVVCLGRYDSLLLQGVSGLKELVLISKQDITCCLIELSNS